MIDRYKYYRIVRSTAIDSACRSVGATWYLDTDGVKTDCIPFLMCTIAHDMLYEMGV